MQKQEFNRLNIEKQIEYVNNLLKENKSVNSICKGIGIPKSTFRDRVTKEGYVFDIELHKYLKNNLNKENTKVEDEKGNIYKSNTLIIKDDSEIKEIISAKKELLALANVKDDLLKLLKEYKDNTKIIESNQLDIETIPDNMKDEILSKTIKVYSEVYELFQKLCNQYNSIKKQDLLSLALLEFCNKYKK